MQKNAVIAPSAAAESKIPYITFMQALCACAVVLLHTNGCFWTYAPTTRWKIANVVESVFYFPVPIFYMISGATLMDFPKKYSLATYFKKRILKAFIPFLAWSLIGVAYLLCIRAISVDTLSVKSVIKGILNTSFISIYWFFPALFCVYLCIPLFAAVSDEHRKTIFSYLIIIGFFVNIAVPFVIKISNTSLSWPFSMSVISDNLWFVICGYLLVKYPLCKRNRLLLYAAAFAGLMVHLIGTQIVSVNAGKVLKTYKGYNNLPSYVYAVGVFVFLRQIGERIMKTKAAPFIGWLSRYSLAIYLIHYYIMDLFRRNFPVDVTSPVYTLGAPLIIIPLCIIIAIVIKKIPLLKHIVP